MTKTISIVALLLLLLSCNNQNDPCAPQANQTETAIQNQDEKPLGTTGCTTTSPTIPDDEEAPSEDVPQEALMFDASVTLTKFNSNDEAKVVKALMIIKKVVRTKEFKDRVLGFTYGGKKSFVDNGGLTNQEIYQKLLDGSEVLNPGIDSQMDLDLELYYSSRSTVGYTYPNVLKIWMNTKYFNVYTPAQVAGNVFHEWTHKLGFDHASSYSVSRDSSVPYALGYLIAELGKKYE
jgi:hypothetical protein